MYIILDIVLIINQTFGHLILSCCDTLQKTVAWLEDYTSEMATVYIHSKLSQFPFGNFILKSVSCVTHILSTLLPLTRHHTSNHVKCHSSCVFMIVCFRFGRRRRILWGRIRTCIQLPAPSDSLKNDTYWHLSEFSFSWSQPDARARSPYFLFL